MTNRFSTMRAAAIVAVCGALALAGCGGGGTSGPIPSLAGSGNGSASSPSSPGSPGQSQSRTTATLSITGLSQHTSTTSASRAVALPSSTKRSPQYIDQTTPNSAIVVSVTPQDPAEAAQYGNLTVCTNLYTNGTLNPNLVTTMNPLTVTVTFPAPPGTDGFQVTQYAGQCGSTPYTLPVPPAGTPNNGVLSQTPVEYALLTAGTANAINTEIGTCTQPTTPPISGSGFVCAGPGTGNGLIVASIAIANIAFGTLPIPEPVREQGAFQFANDKIGIPIPLEGLNAAGTVVPGLTTPSNLNGGSGPIPSPGYVQVTSNDTTTHTALYLVDATNGAIAQTASNATGIKITEFNALAAADITYGGSTAVAGHPWVIVMTFDGTGASAPTPLTSVVVTATPNIPSSPTATAVTATITPQSAVYSAGAAPAGYTDAAAPVAPLAMIQPTAGGAVYFTDGNEVKVDGVNTPSAATGTTLTGLTYANVATPLLYAVDNAVTGGSPTPSGLYAFNPATGLAVTAVTTQDGNGNAVQFRAPVGAVYAADTAGNSKLFVIDGNGIEIVDINQMNQLATNVGPLLCTGTPLAAPPAGVKLFGTVAVNTSSSTFLVSDPGNARVAQVTVSSNFNCAISTYATGAAFTGLFAAGNGALYATSTSGQIYYISGSGATAVSLGLKTSSSGVTDGPIGQLSSLTPSSTPALTPANYPLQFQTGSFFAASATPATAAYGAPYTVAPFTTAGPVFATSPVGIGLAADTSAGATTGAGTVNATGGIVVFPSTATASAVVTPGSILFTDGGTKLRTLVQ